MNRTSKIITAIVSITALLAISLLIAFIVRARKVGLGYGDVGEER
jgi:hypothetical protein